MSVLTHSTSWYCTYQEGVVTMTINTLLISLYIREGLQGWNQMDVLGREPLDWEEFRVVGERHMLSHKVDRLIVGVEEALDRLHEAADQREALRKIPAFSRVCLDE